MEPASYREIAVLALVVGTISLTITKAAIFEIPREWLATKAEKNLFLGWLSDLFECPYCMAHWVAFGVMLIWAPMLMVTGNRPVDLIASYFALVALGSLVAGAIFRILGGGQS